MPITIPTKTDDSIGRVKSDNLPPDVTITDAELDHYTPAAELEALKTAVVDLATEAVATGAGTVVSIALSVNVDDWGDAAEFLGASVIRVTPASVDYEVSGFAVGQTDGKELLVINVGSDAMYLTHDQGSAAANRILTPGAVPVELLANSAARLRYDATSLRWFVIARG